MGTLLSVGTKALIFCRWHGMERTGHEAQLQHNFGWRSHCASFIENRKPLGKLPKLRTLPGCTRLWYLPPCSGYGQRRNLSPKRTAPCKSVGATLLVGTGSGAATGEAVWQFFKQLSFKITTGPSNSTLRCIPEKWGNVTEQEYLFPCVFMPTLLTTAKDGNSPRFHQQTNG